MDKVGPGATVPALSPDWPGLLFLGKIYAPPEHVSVRVDREPSTASNRCPSTCCRLCCADPGATRRSLTQAGGPGQLTSPPQPGLFVFICL